MEARKGQARTNAIRSKKTTGQNCSINVPGENQSFKHSGLLITTKLFMGEKFCQKAKSKTSGGQLVTLSMEMH